MTPLLLLFLAASSPADVYAEKAERLYRELLRTDPEDHEIREKLVRLCLDRKQPDKAVALLVERWDRGDKSETLGRRIVDLCLWAGKPKEAARFQAVLVSQDPTAADRKRRYLEILVAAGELQPALIVAQELAAAFPEDGVLQDQLHNLANWTGRIGLAADVGSERALSASEGEREHLIREALVGWHYMSRDLDALRFLKRAYAQFPEDVFIHKTLANHLDYLGFVSEAEAAYRELLRDDGSDANVRRRLARLCYHRGSLTEALQHSSVLTESGEAQARDFTMALDLALILNQRSRADAIVRRSLASSSVDTAFLKKAEHYLVVTRQDKQLVTVRKRLLELEPQDRRGRLALAETLVLRKDYEGAVRHYRRLIEDDPKDVSPRLHLCALLLTKKDTAAAEATIEVLVPRFDERDGSGVTVFDRLVALLVRHNHVSVAADLLEKHVAADRGSREHRRRLATLYEWLDKPALALTQYEKLFEDNPDNRQLLRKVALLNLYTGNANAAYGVLANRRDLEPILVRIRGEAALGMGQLREAVRDFERYLAKNPDDAGTRSLAAEAYSRLGRHGSSRRHAVRGLAEALADPRAARLRALLTAERRIEP